MKSFKRIAILLIIVTAIVSCWLIPGINKAKDVRYTRRYEDTDKKYKSVDAFKVYVTDSTKVGQTSIPTKKIYKKESIHAGARFSDIKPKMFGRSIQFEPELIELDSVHEVQVSIDSAKDIL